MHFSYLFLFKNHFWPNFFPFAEINLTTRGPLYTCLVCHPFTDFSQILTKIFMVQFWLSHQFWKGENQGTWVSYLKWTAYVVFFGDFLIIADFIPSVFLYQIFPMQTFYGCKVELNSHSYWLASYQLTNFRDLRSF